MQDDDRPTVTVSAPTTPFYGRPIQPYPGVALINPPTSLSVTLTRTGDASGRLPIENRTSYTTPQPAPVQDVTVGPNDRLPQYIPPGATSAAVHFSGLKGVNALGRTHRFFLADPHHCPDDPEACGYRPQYTLGTSTEATLRVYGNFMGVRIENSQATVAEGEAVAFTLHRHGGKPDAMTRPLTVRVQVTQEGDYISGSTPETVTFQANQSSTTLSVATDDDTADEQDGTITATILAPLAYTDDETAYETYVYGGSPWTVYSATTAVTDDDDAQPNISVSDYDVDEDQGSLNFTIELDGPNHQNPVSFDWATQDDGSSNAATAGSDYQASSGSFTLSPGETSQQFSVAITNDTEPEPDETFSIVLTNLSGASPGTTTGTVTIRDNELDLGVTISDIPDGVEEGDEIVFTLQRMPSTAPTGAEQPQDPCFLHGGQAVRCFDPQAAAGSTPLTVQLEITQSGDFASAALPATAAFAAGERFAIVRIPTDDDSQIEATGVLTINLVSGQGYSSEFTGSVSISIRRNIRQRPGSSPLTMLRRLRLWAPPWSSP